MKYSDLLGKIHTAISKRTPLLAREYLQPGLSSKLQNKRFGRISGFTEPLKELYAWHNGTKFVHLLPGETYATGIAKVSFIPVDTFLFVDSEQAIAMMDTWAQSARRNIALKAGVDRYFPVLCGDAAQFMFDLNSQKNGRILYFSDKRETFFQEAYSTFEEFLRDICVSNEMDVKLNFFERQPQLKRLENGY